MSEFTKFIKYKVQNLKDYRTTHKKLKEIIKGKDDELMEFFKKSKEREEELAIIKDAHRLKQQELIEILEAKYQAEERANAAEAELKLIREGISTNGKEIRAVTLVRKSDDIYAPMVITLNESGTEVIKRDLLPEAIKAIAMDTAKIAFVEILDPGEMH